MAEQDKEKKSVLGLGLPASASDPNAWRPSKAAQRAESEPSRTGATPETQKRAATYGNVKPERYAAEAKPNTAGVRAETRERPLDAAAWRPSKVNEERLSSLSPMRPRRRFAMSPRTRLIFTAVLFACGAYFFAELWLTPEAGGLHVVLLIAAVAMALLFVSAIVSAARRKGKSKRGDDQSTLRL